MTETNKITCVPSKDLDQPVWPEYSVSQASRYVCPNDFFLNQNKCCGYSKEPSQWDCSFEHPKHVWIKWSENIYNFMLQINFVQLDLIMLSAWNRAWSNHILGRVPTEIQKHNSMIFPWFSMANNVNSITFNAWPPTSPFRSIFTTQSINVKCSNSNTFK